MPKEESVWGVILTDDAINELGEDIKPYLTEGQHGLYLFCKDVDMSQRYLHIVAEYQEPDCEPCELEIYVPHHYVKLIASSTDKNKIGFL